jgi:hypothetical protein
MSEISREGWSLWQTAAEIMVDAKRDATLWDLAKAMYRYYHNREVPIDEPNDYDLVAEHKSGYSANRIGHNLGLSPEAVGDYLKSMGFNPWKMSLRCDPYRIMRDYGQFPINILSRKHETSRYIVEKIIREFRHAKITGF